MSNFSVQILRIIGVKTIFCGITVLGVFQANAIRPNCTVVVPEECEEVKDSTFSFHSEERRYITFVLEVECLVIVKKSHNPVVVPHELQYKVFLAFHGFDKNRYLEHKGIERSSDQTDISPVDLLPYHISFEKNDSEDVKTASLICS